MSETGHLTTCWSHHRELWCGTDSKPTTPQGTGLRYWPQTVTRTMLSIMQHGRRINKTQDQQYHTSTPWSNITVPPQGCTKTKRIHKTENNVLLLILWERRRPKRSRNGQAPFQQWRQTQCIHDIMFTVCHQYSGQSGPRESPVIILSPASLQRAPLTLSRNQEECEGKIL